MTENTQKSPIESLYEDPCFIVSIDRCINRYDFAYKNVSDAGFKNITRFVGVDAAVDNLEHAWAVHGNPKLNEKDTEFVYEWKGKQGCMLSHLNIWKQIIDNKTPRVTVFEDDVRFHSEWKLFAPQYMQHTPNDYHILYLGSQIELPTPHLIAIVPVYCTHAYVITYEGAKHLYNLIMTSPGGVYTIDIMFYDLMWKAMYNRSYNPFIWYVWNGTQIPDQKYHTRDPSKQKRNQGLVFQDDIFESEVKKYPFGKA
jgi:GR25 family glycosyltransferase involved in LPS biosynthesis